MQHYILILILLIAISCGVLYICVQKTIEPLDTFSNKCLKGCRPATIKTGNCRPVYNKNKTVIYSCPQECGTNNLSRKADTCSYDEDCKLCKKTLMDSKGRPLKPRIRQGPPGRRPVPLPPPAPARSPSPTPASAHSPSPTPIPPHSHGPTPAPLLYDTVCSNVLPSNSLPASIFTQGKNLGGSSLYPGSTIIIFDQ